MAQLDALTTVVGDVNTNVAALKDRVNVLDAAVQAAITLLGAGNQQGAIDALTGTLTGTKENIAAAAGVVNNDIDGLTAVLPPAG